MRRLIKLIWRFFSGCINILKGENDRFNIVVLAQCIAEGVSVEVIFLTLEEYYSLTDDDKVILFERLSEIVNESGINGFIMSLHCLFEYEAYDVIADLLEGVSPLINERILSQLTLWNTETIDRSKLNAGND